MRRSLVLLAAAAVLLAAPGSESVDQPVRDHDITVDDYFTIANILEVAVSPDGRTAAFIENRWDPPAETRNADLWTLDLETWRATKLFDATRVITAIDVAGDGRVAMITTPDEELIHNEGWSRVDVWDPTTRTSTVVTGDGWRAAHPSPFGWVNEVA